MTCKNKYLIKFYLVSWLIHFITSFTENEHVRWTWILVFFMWLTFSPIYKCQNNIFCKITCNKFSYVLNKKFWNYLKCTSCLRINQTSSTSLYLVPSNHTWITISFCKLSNHIHTSRVVSAFNLKFYLFKESILKRKWIIPSKISVEFLL